MDMKINTKKIIAGILAGSAILAKTATICPEKIQFDGKEYCVNEETMKAINGVTGFGGMSFGNIKK